MSYYDDKENKIRRRKVSSNNEILKNNKNNISYKKNIDNGNIKIENSTIYKEEKMIGSRVKNKKINKPKRFIKSILILILSALVVVSSVGSVFVISAIKGSKPVTYDYLKNTI